MASEAAASSNSPTWVRIGRRAAGGVFTMERSRIPVNAISRVRGMGLAVRVRTSMPSARALIDSLWLTPNRCSSSTTNRPSFLKAMSPPRRRWVPTTTSTEPSASPAITSRAWALVKNRLSIATFNGNGAYRSAKVWACWLASRVVGTSTAAWYPSWTALNTARMATSVLPKPTSPHTSRSMGWGRSMSAFTSSMARSWSEVSMNGNDDSNSACHGVSGPKAWPVTWSRRRYSATNSSATSCTAARALDRAFCHSDPPSRLTVGESPPAYGVSSSI